MVIVAEMSRCMALSVAIFVGTAREWIPELIERAKNLKVTGGFEEGADLYVAFLIYPPLSAFD